MERINKKKAIVLLMVILGLAIVIQVSAKKSIQARDISLRPLTSIRWKNGISKKEAVLIAQHCLNKSPYVSRYLIGKDSLRIKEESGFYQIFFASASAVKDDCALTVLVDAVTGSSDCFCQKADQSFQLKTGFVDTDDHQKIHYDHYQNGFKKVVIMIHGFYNSKEAVLFKKMARDLNTQYDVLVMDVRGHGLSSGFFAWTSKSSKDLEAVLDYAAESYEKIGVIGFSLGAATSIIAAAESDQIDSLISVSAPTSFSKIDGKFWTMGIEENIVYNVFEEGRVGKGVRPGFLWLKKTKPIDAVSRIKVPTLFVHGEKDWLINSWHSKELFSNAQCQKEIALVKNGTHAEYMYRSNPQGTMAIFKDWFKRTLKEESE